MDRIVFHLPRSWLGPEGTGLAPFYEALTKGLSQKGVPFVLTPLNRDLVVAQVERDTAFHVINHGRFQHPRVLNAGVAYIYPFWNMDPKGIRAFSSIADLPFDPRAVDAEIARPFFRALRRRLVGARKSRYLQPEHQVPMPENPVAVFLQSEAHRGLGETCYLDQFEMVETVLETVSDPVVVKPHPLDEDPQTRVRLEKLAAKHSHLHVIDCNIHDLLSRCTRAVTINSAVGVEAYLHRKPVILCGQSDFHHVAQIAKTPRQLAQHLQAPVRKRAYDKFIYWYFGHHCLSTTEPNLTGRFLARLDQTN